MWTTGRASKWGLEAEPQRGPGGMVPEAESLWRKFVWQIRPVLDSPATPKNTGSAHRSHEHPLVSVGCTCPPQSTAWRHPDDTDNDFIDTLV